MGADPDVGCDPSGGGEGVRAGEVITESLSYFSMC